ncbi:hypothetical protein REPUB_Repub18cG0125300 [Reevesia pubescens]
MPLLTSVKSVESKPLDISFNVKGCPHFYCIECITKYIESKLDDNVTQIPCPVTNCQGLLEPDFCRDIHPRDLFNMWGKALCEFAFLGSEFYCPSKDCSALLINDGENVIKNLPCPFCKRVFCVQCKVAWHSGVDCAKFQKLKVLGTDAMLVDLAKRKKWRQCPKCNYYMEKSDGCYYLKCRSRYAELINGTIVTDQLLLQAKQSSSMKGCVSSVLVNAEEQGDSKHNAVVNSSLVYGTIAHETDRVKGKDLCLVPSLGVPVASGSVCPAYAGTSKSGKGNKAALKRMARYVNRFTLLIEDAHVVVFLEGWKMM